MKPSIESGRAYIDSLGMVFVSNGKEFGDVIKSCFDTKEEAIAFANSWNNYSTPQERKCKNVQDLLIPGIDEIDPSFSFVLNQQ